MAAAMSDPIRAAPEWRIVYGVGFNPTATPSWSWVERHIMFNGTRIDAHMIAGKFYGAEGRAAADEIARLLNAHLADWRHIALTEDEMRVAQRAASEPPDSRLQSDP